MFGKGEGLTAHKISGGVFLLPSDRSWPARFSLENNRLREVLGPYYLSLEHFGSTAIPSLVAKPVIDMMGCIGKLELAERLRSGLMEAGYLLHDVGFSRRYFFRKEPSGEEPAFHLHLVVCPGWPLKNEILFRDWLVAFPEVAQEYGKLKRDLARLFPDDLPAYTAGKSAFIRSVVNSARVSRGLAEEVDWTE